MKYYFLALLILTLFLVTNSQIGYIQYTIYLNNMSTVEGVTPNFFSSISPTYMTVSSSGNVYVVAVNEIYAVNPYGKIIGKVNIQGAEYISYCEKNNTLITASGTLPNFTISFISAKNLTVIKTINVKYYPLSVMAYNGEIYIGTYNGIGILKGDNISIITKAPGPIVSLAYSNGGIYAVGYNFTESYGFLLVIHNDTVRSIILSTFPNFVYSYGSKIYIAGDFSVIMISQNNFKTNYVNVSGEKFEGITVDPKNNLTYVTADSLFGPDYILVLNGTRILGQIFGGITPIGIVFDNISNLLFVSNFFDGTISVISTNGIQNILPNNYQFPINQNYVNNTPHLQYYMQDLVLFIIIIFMIFIFIIYRRHKEI